jgi:hypothetical protein
VKSQIGASISLRLYRIALTPQVLLCTDLIPTGTGDHQYSLTGKNGIDRESFDRAACRVSLRVFSLQPRLRRRRRGFRKT